MRLLIVLTMASSLIAAPAVARDRTGYRQIASGDLAGAERTLVAERRIFPARPEFMLNLAAVYSRTGRPSQAAALYGAVLAAPDVALELPDGATASSHAIARAGRARLAQVDVQVAGR